MRIKINKILNSINSYWKTNLKSVLIFEMIYKILLFLIFTPLISYVLKITITEMGFINLTNNELINLAIKIPGIIGVILVIILSFIAIFIEIGVLTYIANKFYKNERVNLLDAFFSTVKILPNTFGIYIVPILIMCGIIGPIGGLGLSISLMRDLSIPLFIKVELFRTMSGKIFLTIGVLLAIIISIRWMLSIPIVIIEKINLKNALKRSREMYSKKKLNIFKYLAIWIIANIAIRGLLYYSYMLLIDIVVVGPISAKTCFLIFLIGYVIVSILTLPLFIALLVKLYYTCRDYEVVERSMNINYDIESKKMYNFINSHKIKLGIVLVAIFTIIISQTSLNSIYRSNKENEIFVTAHRGNNRLAPENSISSITKAIDYFADYVEIDVMTTKDNEVVLFHDPTLKRFDKTNRRIKDMTLEEVKKVDIGTAFDNNSSIYDYRYEGEKIPTLEEVFKEFKGKIKFNVELKPNGKDDTLEKEVAKIIKEYEMEDDVVISSLDYNSLMKFKHEDLDVRLGYILTFGIGDFSNIDVDFVSVEYGMLSKQLIYTMHSLGKEVHVWTLNTEEEVLSAAMMGVDNIITDEVWGSVATLMSFGYRPNELGQIENINYKTWLFTKVSYVLKYINI